MNNKWQNEINYLTNLMNSPMFTVLKDLQKQQDILRDILRSPALENLKAFQQQQTELFRTINSPTIAVFRDIQKQQELFRNFLNVPIIQYFDDFRRQHEQILSLYNKQVFQYSTALQAFSNGVTKDNIFTEAQFAFIKQLSQGLPINAEGELVYEDIETYIEEIVKKFIEIYQHHAPRSLITFDSAVGILLSILLFICSIQMSIETEIQEINIERKITETEDRINKRIEQSKEDIMKAIENVMPEKGNEIIYVVKRPVNLRSGHSTKSTVIGYLYPNQIVSLEKSRNKWIYVRCFDHTEGVTKTGWVYKKYLQRLSN